jgi:hypothetical protein
LLTASINFKRAEQYVPPSSPLADKHRNHDAKYQNTDGADDGFITA